MISIAGEIRTGDFARVRIGIGPLPPGRDAADFVLEAFKRDERADLERGLEQAAEALELVLDGGIERAMTRFNKRKAMTENSGT
jgi:PTH1 family peptidyl-tRNA hydrolase